ncbi:hypothetical protein JTE90_028120 [Oedothorax gibbosus]|uniref:F-box domain-containing protein n=1 Tax=Oedothorax gibbosus TaxID=931172 RepID=A0AAV6V8G2_9ARAC|nr:hypothetical protein JTE90_028120 [Oedothorax gibbosus]
MNFTPLKKGFLPSSTPIQSLGDSGFFDSENKSLVSKNVHTLSPIKECSPSKKRYTLAQLTRTYSLETPVQFKVPDSVCLEETPCISNELAKELDFNNLSEFSESLEDSGIKDKNIDCNQFPLFYIEDLYFPKFESKKLTDEVQLNRLNSSCNNSDVLFSPIKYAEKVKENESFKYKKVDFFEELSNINCNFIISSILSSLPSDDLCRICCVNKKWKSIVLHDIKANSRRKAFLKDERSRKENQPCKASLEAQQLKQTLAGNRKTVLSDVINTTTFKQPLEKTPSKFDSFVMEGQNMKNGILMKCPSCQYAAKKAGDTDEYCCTKCNYTFCHKCLNPFLENHSCNKLKVSIVIGSKRSKKSLKRL